MPYFEPVPQPADAVPPGVTDSGAQGSGTKYARDNHTHASKARKEIKALNNVVTYTWVYPVAFASGVVPICNAIAQASTNDLINVQIDSPPTNTQCVFRIIRYQQSVVGLISLTVLSLLANSGAINLHMTALEP